MSARWAKKRAYNSLMFSGPSNQIQLIVHINHTQRLWKLIVQLWLKLQSKNNRHFNKGKCINGVVGQLVPKLTDSTQ